MKKTILIVLFFVITNKALIAQTPNWEVNIYGKEIVQKKMEYGFLTGVNLNTARGKNILPKKDLGTYIGKSIGGFFKINLSKKLGIKCMLQYDQNGYKLKNLTFADINGNTISNPTNVIIRNTYMNIPILAEYSIGEKVKVNFNAGPFIGLGLSNFILLGIDGVAANGEQLSKKQKSESFKKFNVGLSVGINAAVPLTKKMDFNFGVKNNFGVTNIFKSIPNDNSINLNAFSVLGGVSFWM
jgi:Outer membrane protein beta-barrel domain